MDQINKRFFFYCSFANLVREMFVRVPSTVKRVKWILSEVAVRELLWVNRKRHNCSILEGPFISNDNNEQLFTQDDCANFTAEFEHCSVGYGQINKKQFYWMKTGRQEFVKSYKAFIEFWYSNQHQIWFRMTLQFFQPFFLLAHLPFCSFSFR